MVTGITYMHTYTCREEKALVSLHKTTLIPYVLHVLHKHATCGELYTQWEVL